jgi:YidC/Oxa1 family membrane protein insertase
MSLSQRQGPIFDLKLVVGVVVVVLFSVFWQNYLNAKYPQPAKATAPNKTTDATISLPQPSLQPHLDVTAAEIKNETKLTEKQIELSFEDVDFVVSSFGMGFPSYKLKKYKTHDGAQVALGKTNNQTLFSTAINGETVNFVVQKTQDNLIEGVSQGLDQVEIRKTLLFSSSTNSFEAIHEVINKGPEKRIDIFIPDQIRKSVSTSWLFPSYDMQDFFIGHSATTERVSINHSKEDVSRSFNEVSFISVGDQYFSSAILDQSETAPMAQFSLNIASGAAEAKLSYRAPANQKIQIKQVFFAGPKEINNLKAIDPAMAGIVDFGWLAFIAKPLLWIMKAMHSLTLNWGVAIILLTLIVRLAVLPIHMTSVRSMRAMQKIQPLMQQVREKYKDDPMAQQREIMQLMKTHKANPLGGCLPMLMQIPIFFALYSMIGSSVELYQSPFFGWIQDLSAHDHYFVLPALMGATMFFQSKITPMGTMDPMQAKIMLYLPLLFTVFMLYLPAGLTLYMFVSGLFGIAQQYYFMREQKAEAKT